MMLWNRRQRKEGGSGNGNDAPTLQQGIYGPSWLFTIRDSGHQNQSDFPILFQRLMRHVPNFGGKCNPVDALLLNNRICLEFIRQMLLDPNKPSAPLSIPADDNVLTGDLTKHPPLLLLHRLDGTVSQGEKDILADDSTTADPEAQSRNVTAIVRTTSPSTAPSS
ncbi:hypothetical protein SYNPS1DRAFT_26884 [Syncephalis pseudoplumigaleata]|uniref:Uncharacterized protein n=1 Tax=Syncephalis pseudoplumigaleata TaxID=1712513 RepID=A0A4P9Z5T6_9FUNG|nr:hypothetical protein SYNPS1DRAFT_26884 [Syncephalis pseudoplumigaleata]|eukprot:RKP27452.1 hypothetical protein SYNPS1DRAFT_26884 [Syncephalis pseudoplumigaleata]